MWRYELDWMRRLFLLLACRHIGAHSRLDHTASGHYCDLCSVWLIWLHVHPHERILFLFFEGPKGRYGPREAWAHMGWVGHPAHYRSRFIFLFLLSHVHSPSARYRLQCTTQRVVHMCTPKGCTLYNACARVRVYVKPRRGNLGHFTRDLGQN